MKINKLLFILPVSERFDLTTLKNINNRSIRHLQKRSYLAKLKFTCALILLVFASLLLTTPVSATQRLPPEEPFEEPQIPGTVEVVGTDFQTIDGEDLNITLNQSQLIMIPIIHIILLVP